MKNWEMCRVVGRGMLVVGLMMQSTPVAWAQLAEVDPALHAAVEALIAADPEVAGDAELAQLCRTVAESTITDIRERTAVAQEVAVMQREGVDIKSVIPDAVRETAREKFTQVRGEMQREMERMRGLGMDPEKAKEMELRMREGERQMTAFASGEHYVPSTEMIAHATEMFNGWESDMVSRGAPQAFVERARMEMARFSTGEMAVAFAGPMHEFGGPMGGQAPMPSIEQMQAMGMTADQIQAAQAGGHTGGSNYGINPATGGWEPGMGGAVYGGGTTGGPMPSTEQMQAMGMTADQIQAAQAGGHTLDGRTYGGGDRNYGINPATGGWEPNMGGGPGYTGGTTDWGAGGGAHTGYTDWSAGGGTYTGGTTDWSAGGGTYTGGTTDWGAGGGTYTGGTTDWGAGGGTYGGTTWEGTSTGGTTAWEGTHTTTETYTTTTDSTQAAQERHAEVVTAAHTRVVTHTVADNGHAEEHWDGNGDGLADHTHPVGTAAH